MIAQPLSTIARRLLRPSLVCVGAFVLGALAWDVLQHLQIDPTFTRVIPEPKARARTAVYTVMGAGATITTEKPLPAGAATEVTLRAWAPTPRISVAPTGAGGVVVRVSNLPRRARLSAPPGVTERAAGSTSRVVSGPPDRPWEFQYVQPETTLTFAVLGDTGASPTFAQALQTARTLGADFFVVVGDLVYRDADVAVLSPVLNDAPVPVYVIRGNHDFDTKTRREFVGQLAPPFYAFTYGGALFVMLDTEVMRLPGLNVRSEQYRWLTRTLGNPGGAPVFVFGHRPPLRFWHRPPRWHQLADRSYPERLAAEFERAGVRMVFAGHHHEHDVRERGGVTYVVSGEGKTERASHPVMAIVAVRSGATELRFVPIWPTDR